MCTLVSVRQSEMWIVCEFGVGGGAGVGGGVVVLCVCVLEWCMHRCFGVVYVLG